MSAEPLALASASARLRGKPGRPPKLGPPAPRGPVQLGARLLDVPSAAAFMGISVWTLRELVNRGVLHRVRVPLPGGGELRKVLLDRADLEDLVVKWKEVGR